jgi:hypothetical protein
MKTSLATPILRLRAKMPRIGSPITPIQETEIIMVDLLQQHRVTHDLGVRRSWSLSFSPGTNYPITDKKAKETRFPRAKAQRPVPPRKDFDQTSPRFRSEYESMSPEMKAYIRSLGFNPDTQDSLAKEMGNVSLDDREPQRSRSPGSFGRHTPDDPVVRKGKARRPASYDSDEDEETDSDSPNGDFQQHSSSSFTHNDNRVITKHINSHNVNTENVVDSYNDNSTRTDIKKNSGTGTLCLSAN